MKNVYWNNFEDVEMMVTHLAQGQLIAGSSDTVPGLLAVVSQAGKDALDMIKGRSAKPYIVLVQSTERLESFVQQGVILRWQTLMQVCWPGPVTLILPTNAIYVPLLGLTVAVRVPQHEGLHALLGYFPGLFSTSANQSGHPTPNVVADMDPTILEHIECVVDQSSDKTSQPGKPSLLLDCTGDQVRVVRGDDAQVAELELRYGHRCIR